MPCLASPVHFEGLWVPEGGVLSVNVSKPHLSMRGDLHGKKGYWAAVWFGMYRSLIGLLHLQAAAHFRRACRPEGRVPSGNVYQ